MRKKILCPICGKRVIDADNYFEFKIFAESSKQVVKGELFIKCWGCKSQLGLEKLNNLYRAQCV